MILVCQKRHHKPHTAKVIDPVAGAWNTYCDGLPRWLYQRPKPPRGIGTVPHIKTQRENNTITVYQERFDRDWYVIFPTDKTWQLRDFPTHAAAITYAQKLAQERTQQNGLVQGR